MDFTGISVNTAFQFLIGNVTTFLEDKKTS